MAERIPVPVAFGKFAESCSRDTGGQTVWADLGNTADSCVVEYIDIADSFPAEKSGYLDTMVFRRCQVEKNLSLGFRHSYFRFRLICLHFQMASKILCFFALIQICSYQESVVPDFPNNFAARKHVIRK